MQSCNGKFSYSLFALVSILLNELKEDKKIFFDEFSKEYELDSSVADYLNELKRYFASNTESRYNTFHSPFFASILEKNVTITVKSIFYSELIEELSNNSLLLMLYIIDNVFLFYFLVL